MKKIASLLMTLALAGAAYAGPVSYSGKDSKAVVPPVVETGCACFEPGFAMGIFGAGFLPDNDSVEDDVLGGGVLLEYFFNPYIGVQATYGIFATDSEHHEYDGALVLRYPITSICLAPYVMVGGGGSTNSEQKGNYFAGAGLEYRIESASCLGIFADGAYHWDADEEADYTIVRLGVKFPF